MRLQYATESIPAISIISCKSSHEAIWGLRSVSCRAMSVNEDLVINIRSFIPDTIWQDIFQKGTETGISPCWNVLPFFVHTVDVPNQNICTEILTIVGNNGMSEVGGSY